MGCCIVAAMLISQMIWIVEKARENFWFNLSALALAAAGVGLLIWHWHHIEELILNPFTFSFIADLLNQAGSYCRSVVR